MARKGAPTVAARGPRPLLVVAGLPRPTANIITGTIEKVRDVKVVAAPFGHAGPAAYTEDAIRTLLERACGFALRDRSGKPVDPVPSPGRLLLAYVEQPGWDRLIDAFGISALPLPMRVDGWSYPRGKDWRERIDEVRREVLNAFDTASAPPRRALRSRLENRSSAEKLLLPVRNFRTSQGVLFDDLLACLKGTATWDEFGHDIEIRRFPFEELSAFYVRVGGDNVRYPVDARGLVFANSLGGRHARVRVLPDEPKPSVSKLRALLESMFRLGTPLLEGFQHDVQWPWDEPLKNVPFDCSEDGQVDVSGSHANIYPDDYIRPGGEKAKKVKAKNVKGGQ